MDWPLTDYPAAFRGEWTRPGHRGLLKYPLGRGESQDYDEWQDCSPERNEAPRSGFRIVLIMVKNEWLPLRHNSVTYQEGTQHTWQAYPATSLMPGVV